jgi:opacity protein-like surface antigen
MRPIIMALLSGALLLHASTGLADEQKSGEFAREGGYLGLSGFAAVGVIHSRGGTAGKMFSVQEKQLLDKASVFSAEVDTGWGLNGRAGWRHSPHIATELQLEVVIDRDHNVNGDHNETRNIAGTFNVKVPFVTTQVQPYAIAGLGIFYTKIAGTTKDDSTHFMLRGGLGLDMYVTEHWVVNTEATYVYPVGSGTIAPGHGEINSLDYVSVGIGFAYRF